MRTLYVSDLDGTLLRPDGRVSAYSLGVLNRLIEAGVLFTYATARSLSSASVVTEGLRMRVPVIVYNGAHIVDARTGERLASETFSGEARAYVQGQLRAHGVSPIVYAFVDGRESVSWDAEQVNAGKRFYLDSRQGDRRLRRLEGADGLFDGEVFYYTCIGTQAELRPLYGALAGDARYTCTLQQELYRPEYWLEIMPRRATKADALAKLRALLHCDRAVAFGDSVNDMPLFRAADACYAVKNATDALKRMATGIIDGNSGDGVARWLARHACAGE